MIKGMPKTAKQVFKGQIFSVYQWRQKMFDNSYEIFEAIGRPDSVEVIAITKTGKFIVLKQKQPNIPWFLTLPGGRMDKGETPRQAASRELMEETGHKADKINFLVKSRLSSKLIYYAHIFYALDCVKIGPLDLDIGEKIEVNFYTLTEFLKLSENPDFRCSGNLKMLLLKALYSSKHRRIFQKMLKSNLG